MLRYGETSKTWHAELDGKDYVFRAEHQFWTGRKKYFINDELVKHTQGGLIEAHKFGSKALFVVDAHEIQFLYRARTYDAFLGYTLFVRDLGIKTVMTLLIDGVPVEGEQQQSPRCASWIIPSVLGIVVLAGLYFSNQA